MFKNVKVFDGKSDKLTASTMVLVVGNRIEKIGGAPAVPARATVIDGASRRRDFIERPFGRGDEL